jgi:dihydrofolate reductase
MVGSIEEAIEKAKQTGDNEIFVIGGAEIFKQSMHLADTLYVTKIHHFFEGDVFFPVIKPDEWKETDHKKGVVDEKNKYEHDFLIFEKIR